MKSDLHTSTVDGAEGFARMYNSEPEIENSYEKVDWESLDEDEDFYEEEECNCSDPGCPCGGYKIGGL